MDASKDEQEPKMALDSDGAKLPEWPPRGPFELSRLEKGLPLVMRVQAGLTEDGGETQEKLVTLFCSQERADALAKMEHQEGDVWVCTYPKAGTTFTQAILYLLLIGEMPPDFMTRFPWLEIGEVPGHGSFAPSLSTALDNATIKNDQGDTVYRLFKSHWWATDHMRANGKSKVIYVVRNGFDVAVSYFHHTNALRLYEYNGHDVHEFFDIYMKGDVDFGTWWEHVLGWWNRSKNDPNVLLLYYSDMKRDLNAQVRRIAEFLDVEGRTGQAVSDEKIEWVCQRANFKSMKKTYDEHMKGRKEMITKFRKTAEEGGESHVRKGVVGDSKEVLTDEERSRFLAACEEYFEGSDFDWKRLHDI
eukprot:TRINITY_DN14811_c0_g1_i1.p2 TRINITY_DN14811_c0_g1~~TRINITY_DN14811_c0_g1_i1.p2  ORF type:complete len:360 (+),score=94.48 TRINITY_DN14811_c0_g1_i1:118-1197(+)